MPFVKIGPNTYRSPSGRTFTAAQVRLYYANGGHFPKKKKPHPLHNALSKLMTHGHT